jgi:hypothetical protein
MGLSHAVSPEEVLQRNRTLATNALQPFAGNRLVGEILLRREISAENVEEPKYRYEFHIATTRRWRLNVFYNDGFELVIVRNGGLFFTAVRQSKEHPFNYTAVGFDRAIQQDVTESALARSGIIEGTTQVMGVTASDFLTGDYGVEIRRVLPIEGTIPHIRWEWERPAKNASGSIELLESGLVSAFKSLADGTEVTIDYEEGLPIRMATVLNANSTEVNRVQWSSDPNSDTQYYTPESIGLRSPNSPWRAYAIYALVVIACASIATWIVRLRRAP